MDAPSTPSRNDGLEAASGANNNNNNEQSVSTTGSVMKIPLTTSSSPLKDPATRILKRGDLARIQHGSSSTNTKYLSKLKDHIGDLGRIIQSMPIDDDDDNPTTTSHPFRYDLEFVLGGKFNGIDRADLLYTTASAEGMTGDSAPKRRIKKAVVEEESPPLKKKPATKKKKKQTTATNKKGGKNASGAKRKAGGSKKGTGKKSKTTTSVSEQSTPPTAITAQNSTMDMYERHRREFERSLIRLEKADSYSYFGSLPTPEIPSSTTTNDGLQSTSTTSPPLQNGATITTSNHTTALPLTDTPSSATPMATQSTKPNVPTATTATGEQQTVGSSSISQFPPTTLESSTSAALSDEEAQPNQKQTLPPPTNFACLRKRMADGRYVKDRQSLEMADFRKRVLLPYYKSMGKRMPTKKKVMSMVPVLHPQGVDWDLFKSDLVEMCETALERDKDASSLSLSAGSMSHAVKKIQELMEQIYDKTARKQENEMSIANERHRFAVTMEAEPNNEPAMQKKWRREAFPERCYERLKTDRVCAGLSELDERIAKYELKTTLRDSFVGLSYTYDDTYKSEGWMKTLLNEADEKKAMKKAATALASDDGVIKAQVQATMQTLLIAVQDKVMTENGVLNQTQLRSANWEAENDNTGNVSSVPQHTSSTGPEIVELPVWGIDCYTRRNISSCLGKVFDSETILTFLEKWLLPAINACPVDIAHDLKNAARILEGLSFDESLSTSLKSTEATTSTETWSKSLLGKALLDKISKSGPTWLPSAARMLRKSIESMGLDFFRVHPKGHGSIVLSQKLEPNRLVTYYRGEIYPSWRWGEKMNAVSTIQQKKGLKPVLPDFFNMALERPQLDPRGYGLLFVDASRKSGYGSMLSHSCHPSCEVRVAAVNGVLTLAMTTLREMSIGDELTFDYNAVTESLNEYQSAICLCGHGACRGSFLHFATADCYQQVLNRNAPVAVRLASLIKGSMKRVMSDDDDAVLRRHGFQTAVFGAVSVNRRKVDASNPLMESLDSMEVVPVWLRTFVADTLRYIEYERRALPIALICNDVFDDEDGTTTNGVAGTPTGPEDDTPIKGWKPEPSFFYYSRTQRHRFVQILMKDDANKKLSGGDLRREVSKLVSDSWKSMDDKDKERFKKLSFQEWAKNGGKEKARLMKERRARTKKTGKDGETKSTKEKKKAVADPKAEKAVSKPKITFQAADAEGLSAMEQRIQQLTQALSRVGRVLDRHREEKCQKESNLATTDDSMRDCTHAPLDMMTDEDYVAWMWNHKDSPIQILLQYLAVEVCVSPTMHEAVKSTIRKYESLRSFGSPWLEGSHPTPSKSPAEGRKLLNEALLELRRDLLQGIQSTAKEIKENKAALKKHAIKQKGDEEVRLVRREIESVMCSLIEQVETRVTGIRAAVPHCTPEDEQVTPPNDSEETTVIDESNEALKPWLYNYSKRFKIEKAADVLLMYAKTSTFFVLKPYESLRSSPIEVYARDLGNAVPVSAKDALCCQSKSNLEGEDSVMEEVGTSIADGMHADSRSQNKKSKALCEPEEIISNVVVEYQGDYVLSQLLQWYNAGIDQKPGLPDLIGCAIIPPMAGSWTIDYTSVSNSHTDRSTRYHSFLRRKLIDWMKDPMKRGSPLPDDIRRAFAEKVDLSEVAPSSWSPIGSPILDFLVTGEDYNINSIIDAFEGCYRSAVSTERTQTTGLLSSVDHGRPAQAVSNWVQCENTECQKWRKIPWHVDIDELSEKFYCKDNIWNPKSASCDAAADEWDENTDAQVAADGSAHIADTNSAHIADTNEPSTTKNNETTAADDIQTEDPYSEPINNDEVLGFEYVSGNRFDVKRDVDKRWYTATVMYAELKSEHPRVKFHYKSTQTKCDEWVEVTAHRVAALGSKVTKRRKYKRKAPSTAPQPKASEQKMSGGGSDDSNQADESEVPYDESESSAESESSSSESMADAFNDTDDESTEPLAPKKPSVLTSEAQADNDRNESAALVTEESSPDCSSVTKQSDESDPFRIPRKKASNVVDSGITKQEKPDKNRIPRKSQSVSPNKAFSLLSGIKQPTRSSPINKKSQNMRRSTTPVKNAGRPTGDGQHNKPSHMPNVERTNSKRPAPTNGSFRQMGSSPRKQPLGSNALDASRDSHSQRESNSNYQRSIGNRTNDRRDGFQNGSPKGAPSRIQHRPEDDRRYTEDTRGANGTFPDHRKEVDDRDRSHENRPTPFESENAIPSAPERNVANDQPQQSRSRGYDLGEPERKGDAIQEQASYHDEHVDHSHREYDHAYDREPASHTYRESYADERHSDYRGRERDFDERGTADYDRRTADYDRRNRDIADDRNVDYRRSTRDGYDDRKSDYDSRRYDRGGSSSHAARGEYEYEYDEEEYRRYQEYYGYDRKERGRRKSYDYDDGRDTTYRESSSTRYREEEYDGSRRSKSPHKRRKRRRDEDEESGRYSRRSAEVMDHRDSPRRRDDGLARRRRHEVR